MWYRLFCLLTFGAVLTPAAGASQSPAAAPHVFTWRAEALQRAKERLERGDSALRPALDQLLREADHALQLGPFSVTDKRRAPPSGDRHDYMSMGPYWWPNPSKPDGLPYVRRDGERNPESLDDSDSPRWNAMAEAVETLGLAYYFSGKPEYARHAAKLLRTWFLDPATRMNPHLEFGQAIPGVTEGRGIGIIDTAELPRLLDTVGLVEPSDAWTDADQAGMEAWASAYLDWLWDSEKGRDERATRNNHATWYDAQTAALALFVGRTGLARRIVETAKSERIAKQITPTGEQPEELARTRSLGYSTMNLEGMAQLAELARHVGVDLWSYRPPSGGGIRSALDYLAVYVDPARKWPHQEIAGTSPDFLLRHLSRAALVYGDPSYRRLIQLIPPELVRGDRSQLLYPD